MPSTPIFHVGILAHDIEAAKCRFGQLLGLSFTQTHTYDLLFVRDGTPMPASVTFSFSDQGPPFVELIQTADGGPFDRTAGEGLHHLAAWAPDVEAKLAEMAAVGAATELTIVEHDDPCPIAAYASGDTVHGVRIELVRHSPELPGYTPELPGSLQ